MQRCLLMAGNGNGDWLRRARRREGFRRQEDLAKEVGVGRSAVANWETDRGIPDMANAERLAVVLKRPRAEVLARYGYPIGTGEPVSDLPTLPPEWLAAIRTQIAAGVADGVARVIEDLRSEGLVGTPRGSGDEPRRRRSA